MFLKVIQEWSGVEDQLKLSFGILVVVAVASAILGVSFYYLQSYIAAIFEKNQRDELVRKYLQIDWLYYLDQRSGQFINTVTTEMHRNRNLLLAIIGSIYSLFAVFFYILAVIYVSPIYSFVFVVVFVLLGLIALPIFMKLRQYSADLVDANNQFMQQLKELTTGLKVVKASGMQSITQQLVMKTTLSQSKLTVRVGILNNLSLSILEPALIVGAVGLVYLVRIYQFSSISELAVVALLILRTSQRVMGLQARWIRMAEFLPSFIWITKLSVILNRHKELQAAGEIDDFAVLEFQDVSFSYQANRPALTGLNLAIGQGEFIGVVGSSGAGKTTLVDLILSLLKPTSGTILVNGRSLAQINSYRWRSTIGYVPQETFLFNDTVMNNITLLRAEVNEEAAYWAARVAQVDEFIQTLPDGYQTTIGDQGVKISGGQRQRLALARAIARKPQILLLDEATSALDSMTERKIQQSIEQLRNQLTIIVIAHRLSTIMNADNVIVLERGKIVGFDSPDQLIRNNRTFQEMYTLQTKSKGS